MAKIQNISDIHPTLGFTEFDILEKYRKSSNESELGRLHSVFPFEVSYWKGWGYHNSAEHLAVYVPVQMFHQLSVREPGVGL